MLALLGIPDNTSLLGGVHLSRLRFHMIYECINVTDVYHELPKQPSVCMFNFLRCHQLFGLGTDESTRPCIQVSIAHPETPCI